MTRLVLASNNAGKLREFSALLAPFGFDVVAQKALGIGEAEEPHVTFVENALAKARHAARLSGLPALADDSGLCVDALGGAPGVYSARYAAVEPRSDAANNARLLADLAHLPAPAQRLAHYVCVLVFVRHADDPQPVIAEAEWHGRILTAPDGDGGFGYDPLFWVDATACTVATMAADEKNRRSHRGQAMAKLADQLTARLRATAAA